MASTKPFSRYRNPNTRGRSPSPRSRTWDRFSGSERCELERLSRPEKRHQCEKSSNYENDDRELCMRKLSEFNESMRRQGLSTSTKFQWNNLLADSTAKAKAAGTATVVVTKPELPIQNEKTGTTHSMNPMGIGLTEESRFVDSGASHLKVRESRFVNNVEDFRYPDVGNRGTINDAVGFGEYGEKLGFDPSMISEMARNRIRRTQEATEIAYRKIESARARDRASAIDSFIDRIDGAVGCEESKLNQPVSLPQKFTTEQEVELLHDKRHQQREDCNNHASSQSYIGFSGRKEEVVGYRMDHPQPPKGAPFHDELGTDHVLPQLYPNLEEKSYRNVDEQENEVLGRRMNLAQSKDGAVFVGETQPFKHYVHLRGKSHEMEQENEDFRSKMKMNYHQSPKKANLHGERQELRKDYGHTLPRDYLDCGRESHVKEQIYDVSSFWMNRPLKKRLLLDGERRELSVDYGHSSSKQSPNFDVVAHEVQQENELLDSGMNNRHKRKEAYLHGEKQQMQQECGHSLTQHHLHLNGESYVMDQENETVASRINYPQDQKEAFLQGEDQKLQHDFALESHPFPNQDDDVCNTEGSSMQISATEELGEEALFQGVNQQLQHDCALESYPLPRQDDDVCTTEGSSKQISATEELCEEAFFHVERHQLQRDCALESCPLPKQDDDVCTTEGSTQQISATEELGINSKSSNTHAKKRIIDLRKIRETRINTLNKTSDASNDETLDTGYGGQTRGGADSEQLLLQRNSGYEHPRDENNIHCNCQFSSTHMREFAQPSSSKNIKQRMGLPCQVHNPNPSNRKSIKQRLGSPCQVHLNRKSIKQRLGSPCQGHLNRRNIRQRLGPPCQLLSNRRNIEQRLGPSFQVHNSNGIPRNEQRHKTRKLLEENVSDFYEGAHARDVDLPEPKRGRTVPPEDSKEFKQLVHDAFLKFVKVLNENSSQRRKYIEKGKAETLKCCVCGSKSKEFVDTHSLVMHALNAQSVQRRVDHLGLHNALCVMMGWNSMSDSGSLWAQKALPDAEALAMKEDLVVWPPVVILHNSSIATANSCDRILVSIEELQALLREMGFCRAISKVCRGKPANQSIMTVIFHGTFSGLQEAERLHKLYAENKHGRAEYQQINCSGGEMQEVPVDKVEDVLYGYLAIAGDLDKLHSETKSRSVIKSKKEIYAIAVGGMPFMTLNEKLGSY